MASSSTSYSTFFLLAVGAVICAELDELPSGLKVEVVGKSADCQRQVQTGDLLSVHYTGTLENGEEFDSSLDHNEPFEFSIGTGEAIKGWDEGLMGMCVGEKRKLIVPPEWGYGDEGAGPEIPGGATLHYVVELLDIKDPEYQDRQPASVSEMFEKCDADGDGNISRDEMSNYITKEMANLGKSDEFKDDLERMGEGDYGQFVENLFAQTDTNKDGVISFEELSNQQHDEL